MEFASKIVIKTLNLIDERKVLNQIMVENYVGFTTFTITVIDTIIVHSMNIMNLPHLLLPLSLLLSLPLLSGSNDNGNSNNKM